MKIGSTYNIRYKNQFISGVFIRQVRYWFFGTRYEFQISVHVRDFDYNREYDKTIIVKIKKEDIVQFVKAGEREGGL